MVDATGSALNRRMSTLTRNSTGLSEDPYRADEIPAELYDDTGRRFSEAESFRVDARGRPRIYTPWRSALVAVLLLAFGLTFILLGALHFTSNPDRSERIAFLVIGSIAFIPGAYAVYNLFHAIRGTPGFHLSDIAHFDDFRW
jgi:Transmembrane proteins 230/134